MTKLTMSLLLACVMATSVNAQSRACATHEQVVERLAAGYGETRQSIGMGSNNTVVEVFASLDTGTWTITVTQAGGPTCVVASGQAFQIMAEILPEVASDA